MTENETRHMGGLENSAGGRVPSNYPISAVIRGVLEGTREPHELPHLLHDLWRDGFTVGAAKVRVKLEQAEADADRYYYLAFNGPAARARHEQMLRDWTAVQNRRSTDQRLRGVA